MCWIGFSSNFILLCCAYFLNVVLSISEPPLDGSELSDDTEDCSLVLEGYGASVLEGIIVVCW